MERRVNILGRKMDARKVKRTGVYIMPLRNKETVAGVVWGKHPLAVQ